MEINGLRIRDMKDVQDVLMALETIKSGIENVSDDMTENYDKYNSLNGDLTSSVTTQKEMIEAISYLQIKGNDIVQKINELSSANYKQTNEALSKVEQTYNNFDFHIKKTVSKAVNDLDFTVFQEQIEDLFRDKIRTLESEANKLETVNDSFNDFSKKTLRALKDTKMDMDSSINNFNVLAKIVNYKTIGFGVLGGFFVGCIITMLVMGAPTSDKAEDFKLSDKKAEKTINEEFKEVPLNEIEKFR